ncbi:MAG TPA: hypothetical protein VKX96_13195 [Chloroflexota bacterium]|nr:hypothetical protein [Chloroflexota bacterium]
MPRRPAGSLLVVLFVLIVSPLVSSARTNAAPAPPSPSPTAPGTRTEVSPLADTAASGAGTYLGGSDAVKTFNLPLVRIDTNYDTIIHVSNATATATTVTISLYNSSGNPATPIVTTLAAWGTFDDDLGAPSSPLANGFTGSGTVTSSVSGISVAVAAQSLQQRRWRPRNHWLRFAEHAVNHSELPDHLLGSRWKSGPIADD